jgi:hypothetical protein
MPISPYDGESIIADEVRRIYSEAELRTIEKLAKYIKKNENAEDYSRTWISYKLNEIRNLKGEINEDVIAYLRNYDEKVTEAIEKAYKKGQRGAEVGLNKVGALEVKGTFSATDERAVNALATELVGKLDNTHLRILRSTEDVYRSVIGEVSANITAGVDTRRQAAQRALNKFANRGITGFVDDAGRSWNLSSYAEMATRSTSGRAAINGLTNRAKDNNRDLVIVSEHGEECVLCRPWERQVLSISGNNNDYPSLSEAQLGGLFHANCRHTLNIYIPDLTRNVGNKQSYHDEAGNNLRQQQRYNERMIRKWKRREAAALDDKELNKAKSKVSEWQKKQRDFVNENDRRRKYAREQIDQAR